MEKSTTALMALQMWRPFHHDISNCWQLGRIFRAQTTKGSDWWISCIQDLTTHALPDQLRMGRNFHLMEKRHSNYCVLSSRKRHRLPSNCRCQMLTDEDWCTKQRFFRWKLHKAERNTSNVNLSCSRKQTVRDSIMAEVFEKWMILTMMDAQVIVQVHRVIAAVFHHHGSSSRHSLNSDGGWSVNCVQQPCGRNAAVETCASLMAWRAGCSCCLSAYGTRGGHSNQILPSWARNGFLWQQVNQVQFREAFPRYHAWFRASQCHNSSRSI